jgi:hypothetical protein
VAPAAAIELSADTSIVRRRAPLVEVSAMILSVLLLRMKRVPLSGCTRRSGSETPSRATSVRDERAVDRVLSICWLALSATKMWLFAGSR